MLTAAFDHEPSENALLSCQFVRYNINIGSRCPVDRGFASRLPAKVNALVALAQLPHFLIILQSTVVLSDD